jgi:OFA family oxalate/formate antiporter-like MFS transporter
LYIGYGVIVGFTDGMIYNSVMSCVLKSFPGKAGTISGILLFGFGFGSLALGSLIGALAGAAGIKWTFLILGAIMFVVIIICSLFMTLPSEAEIAAQQKAAAPGGTAGSTKPVHDYTTVQMIKTPAFWFNCLWQIAMAVAGLVIVNSAANIAVYFGLPALLGMIVSVFNGLGRPLEGVFFDKLGRNGGMNIDTVFMFAGAVVLLIALATGVGALVFVGLALVGLGYGGSPAAASATINGFYGPKNYGMNFAAANFIMIPSAIIGPLFSSWLQEISGGQFYSTFVMIAIAAVLAFLLNLGVTITARKGGLEVRA